MDGLTGYFRHWGLISKYGLWWYVLIPGLLSIMMGGLIFAAAWQMADGVGAMLVQYYPFEWGHAAVEKSVNFIGGIGIGAMGFMPFKYLILIIASPFMSFLSERIENKMYDKKAVATFSITATISGMIRGVRLALRNIFKEFSLTFLLFLVGLIPIFSLISAALIIMVQAYYAGFGNMDFTMERRFRLYESVRFVRRNRWFAIGNGLGFVLLLMTGFGFLIALPFGVIGATVGTLDRLHAEEDKIV